MRFHIVTEPKSSPPKAYQWTLSWMKQKKLFTFPCKIR